MIIIHIMKGQLYPRFLTDSVHRLARTMPVVVITGARQTGKSTLVRDLLEGERDYFTLDDLDVLAQAERYPDDLVERSGAMVLDEVQRKPELLLAVKRSVDRNRVPGRFILTGSANLLLMKSVSESLAGRASYLTLWPMTRRERLGLGVAGRWSAFFDDDLESWPAVLDELESQPVDWRELARQGGFPVPALEFADPEDRAIWFDGYIRTYLERDLKDLSVIESLVDFRRLMGASCHRLGQLINQTELGRDVQLSQPTVRRWLNLLETSYQLVRLPAFSVNRTKRLIKTPKAYWADTGLALRLSGSREPGGQDLENLVFSDLLAWRESQVLDRPEVFYWRTAAGEEVDFVVEWRGRLLAVEVKVTRRPRTHDIRHLKTFQEEYGDGVVGCLLLHDGDKVEWLAPGILAAPWGRVV